MSNKKSVKGTFSIKKTWFEPIEPFQFIIEDVLDEELNYRTQIDYSDYKPMLNKAQQAQKDILEYIRTNNLKEVTRKELEAKIQFSESTIKIAIKALLREDIFTEQGQTKNKIFLVNTEIFKPNKGKCLT